MKGVLDELQANRVKSLMGPHVTSVSFAEYQGEDWNVLESNDVRLSSLGITVTGKCRIAVSSLIIRVGKVNVVAADDSGIVIFDNRNWRGSFNALIRFAAVNGVAIFNLHGAGTIALPNVLLRSANQLLFWGRGSTSVQAMIGIEGDNRSIFIGDDALFSSGVWLRNYDMHSIFDLDTLQQLNRPVDMIVERHVWIGQDALVLSCPLIGAGSIIGAKALVKSEVPRKVAFGGLPGKVLRTNVSWGRSAYGITPAELEVLSSLEDKRTTPPS